MILQALVKQSQRFFSQDLATKLALNEVESLFLHLAMGTSLHLTVTIAFRI